MGRALRIGHMAQLFSVDYWTTSKSLIGSVDPEQVVMVRLKGE